MNPAEVTYDWAASASNWLLPRIPFLPDKVRRGVEARRDILARFQDWARHYRTDAPLVWFHAPSVGEGLQTRPVVEAVRAGRSDLQILYTFFSASAERVAGEMPADYVDYMPFDVVDELMPLMEAVRPDAVVFGKHDVWPNVTRVASWRDAKLGLVSGTVAPSSSRLRWPVRLFLSGAYERLDAVGAASQGDALRLAQLGVAEEHIEITGDARFDQVWERAQRIDRTKPPVSMLGAHEGPTLVAGSTWPEDERRLVPVAAQLRAGHRELRVVIAPHEPTADHLSRLEARLNEHRLEHVRYSRVESGAAERRALTVVDRVGILGELYALADIAYVGGGFGRAGLHSALEPAALGVPVLFGPHHSSAREARELVERGAALAVADGEALERSVKNWLDDADARKKAGVAAYGYVRENLGGGRRNADLVLSLLEK